MFGYMFLGPFFSVPPVYVWINLFWPKSHGKHWETGQSHVLTNFRLKQGHTTFLSKKTTVLYNHGFIQIRGCTFVVSNFLLKPARGSILSFFSEKRKKKIHHGCIKIVVFFRKHTTTILPKTVVVSGLLLMN